MSKVWRWTIFGVSVILIVWGLYSLITSKNQIQSQIPGLKAKALDLKNENQDIGDRIDYLKNENNQVKELEEGTSYKPPGEKLIIITSGATSTLSTSTATSSIK